MTLRRLSEVTNNITSTWIYLDDLTGQITVGPPGQGGSGGGGTPPAVVVGAFGNISSPGQINQVVINGNFPGSPSGRSVLDVAESWTAPASGDTPTAGVSVGLAISYSSNSVVFGIASEVCCPTSYAGALPASLVAVNAEVDHNGAGTMPSVSGANFQIFNNSNGAITTGYGNYISVQNFSTGSFTQAYGMYSAVGNRGGNMGLCCAGYFKSGATSGTNSADYTIQIDAPLNGGVFTLPHVGLRIEDQTTPAGTGLAIQIAKGLVDFGTGNSGFGNGSTTNVSSNVRGTGTGPANAGSVVQYLRVSLAGTIYWIPLMQ